MTDEQRKAIENLKAIVKHIAQMQVAELYEEVNCGGDEICGLIMDAEAAYMQAERAGL